MDHITAMIDRVDIDNLRTNLFHIASDPLPCRTLVTTLPGHEKCTLHEADDFLADKLESWGYAVEREPVQMQAYRRDTEKNEHHQYAAPEESDPWYTAYNIYAKKTGTERPDEVIILIAHKDSQSWMPCVAGAYDNAVGTAANLEIARIIAEQEFKRSVWFIFCNEEHTPWSSEVAAKGLAESDLDTIAVFNTDSLGGKAQEDIDRGAKTNVTRYSTDEGKQLAEIMVALNERYGIGLEQSTYYMDYYNDDDGSFIKAGMPCAVLNLGSFPYADPNYHLTTDTADRVDMENVWMSTKLVLAGLLHVDKHGVTL